MTPDVQRASEALAKPTCTFDEDGTCTIHGSQSIIDFEPRRCAVWWQAMVVSGNYTKHLVDRMVVRPILVDLIGHLRDMFGDGTAILGESWDKHDVASIVSEVDGYLSTAEARLRDVTT